jgi:RIO-like serine/threonine protein kinase
MTCNNSPHRKELYITIEQINIILKKYNYNIGNCIYFDCENIGFNNKTYFIYTQNNYSFALRLTKNSWPKEKIECEKELINYIRKNTQIPVPKILCYDNSYKEFDFGWILMEKIDGDNLETLWINMSNENKNYIILQIIEILNQLQSIKLDKIGSLYSYGVGPYFENKRGPFNTSKEFLEDKMNLAIETVNTNLSFMGIKPFVPKLQKIFKKLLQLIDNVPIVLFHGDLSLRNILIKDNKIVSLLDWEWGGSMPIFCEWFNCDIENLENEINNKNIYTPNNIPNFSYIKDIYIIIDNIAPWQIGCFGIEEDKKYIKKSINEIKNIIDKYNNLFSLDNT